MATSFYGHYEPDGRRLGSDFALIGKWAQTFSSLTEPPRKHSSSLSKLSKPDKDTLFSATPQSFCLKDGPKGTVKLETIREDHVSEHARWKAFFKNMDPDVAALLGHDNFRASHLKRQEIERIATETKSTGDVAAAAEVKKTKLAGAGITAAEARGYERIDNHTIKPSWTLDEHWDKAKRAAWKINASVPSTSSGTNTTNATLDNIKDKNAIKIKLIKLSDNGVAETRPQKVPAAQTTPPNKSSLPLRAASSPSHGSETTANSTSSGSPQSSETATTASSTESIASVMSPPSASYEGFPQNNTAATAYASYTGQTFASSVHENANAGIGAALYAYLNGSVASTAAPYAHNTGHGMFFANNTLSVPYSGNYPHGAPGSLHLNAHATTYVPFGGVNSHLFTTANTTVSGFPLANVQVHPEVECYDVPHPADPAELVPLYWTTKDGKSRYLLHKIHDLVHEDIRMQHTLATAAFSSGPVHIFVDLSNIIIGFYDSMKMRRGIPVQARIKPPAFSFENFETVLARGRKAEKKVVAGSLGQAHNKKWPSYMTEAKRLNYEMNILQRVAKPVSPLLHKRSKYRGASREIDSATSGADTSGDENRAGPMKQGEQGVDELLHLKLLQSAFDHPNGGTIVLATGDAAHAEYSDGFKKNIERVLNFGWNIELYGWSRNISQAWRDPAFARTWGDRFRIIELDDFCEELFDVTIESLVQ
ncbi:hypothetical protein B0H66DRAFT_368294 [Apodospora peruviana]|uniref:NYN domain-containing protein n=1 Tax=Apodospora peruviana TaxID=516989 RepID=A0AAE0HW43_9PEZI|nr:hypothetical protein B0H66DRAFT_368294 [Apodospora peruviana]